MLDIFKQAEAERKAEEREKRLAALPSWATERGGIDDLKFCAEFAEVSDETRDSTRFRCVNGRFYSMNGYISDPEMISEIQWELSKLNGLANVGKKAESLLKSLKGYCPAGKAALFCSRRANTSSPQSLWA